MTQMAQEIWAVLAQYDEDAEMHMAEWEEDGIAEYSVAVSVNAWHEEYEMGEVDEDVPAEWLTWASDITGNTRG